MKPSSPPFDAVVLAGGAGRRLGGVDKAALEVGGRPLLDRVLGAVAHANRVVVAGPTRPAGTHRPVVWVEEEPPGGGPVAGLAAALAEVREAVVVVLATDLPFVTPASIDALRAGLAESPGTDAMVGVDAGGRDQWLFGAWWREPLQAAVGALGVPAGRRMGDVGARLRVGSLELEGAPDEPLPSFDVDTPADLVEARDLVE